MMRAVALSLGFAIACGGRASTSTQTQTPPTAPAAPAASELSPALEPLAWWLGAWSTTDGSEHWVACAGAMYGIALQRSGDFEVMIVDDGEGDGPADGVLRFIAIPGGLRSVEFKQQAIGGTSATFANPAHDNPKTITYTRDGDALRATLGADSWVDFRRSTHLPAPELEDADRAFAAETEKRGVDGWMAWFEPKGGMLRRGARIEGKAIADTMGPLFASGMLRWAPITSGRSGALGWTVGKGSFTGKTPADSWETSYVTIWRKQKDGTWKVLFDTGRPVNRAS